MGIFDGFDMEEFINNPTVQFGIGMMNAASVPGATLGMSLGGGLQAAQGYQKDLLARQQYDLERQYKQMQMQKIQSDMDQANLLMEAKKRWMAGGSTPAPAAPGTAIPPNTEAFPGGAGPIGTAPSSIDGNDVAQWAEPGEQFDGSKVQPLDQPATGFYALQLEDLQRQKQRIASDPYGYSAYSGETADAGLNRILGRELQIMKLAQDERLAKYRQPQVTVDLKGQTKEAEKNGEQRAESFGKIINAAEDSYQSDSSLKMLDHMLSVAPQGWGAEGLVTIGGLVSRFGIDIKGIPEAQVAQAISSEMAAKMKDLLPGPMSDADRDFLVKMVPGIAKQPGANKILIEAALRINERKRRLAEIAYEVREANGGSFDRREYGRLVQMLSESEPLFADLAERYGTLTGGKSAMDKAREQLQREMGR